MKKLSPKTIKVIESWLPELRHEVEKELSQWQGIIILPGFYADEEIFAILPFAAYDYIMARAGTSIDIEFAIEMLNTIEPKKLRAMVSHALRCFVTIHKL